MMNVIPYNSEDGDLLTAEKCAALFNCSVEQMWQLVEAGDLPVVIVPRSRVNRKG